MIDTHAHLDFPDFDKDREEVISRAFDNEVKKIINVGVDLERSRKSVEIAERYENVYASVGMHPDFFKKVEKEFSIFSASWRIQSNSKINKLINELRKLAQNRKVVAIGEIGLDYFSHTGDSMKDEQKENQKKGFLAQIELARELGLPVIVHCREAWNDVYNIIFNFLRQLGDSKQFQNSENDKRQISRDDFLNTKFVLHCYSGEKNDTKKFLKLPNVYFSFSGNITYPKPVERADMLREAIRMIPLERLMLDSDAPYLAPQEFRGKRNEPIYIRYIAEMIGKYKNIGLAEVEKATDKTAEIFFGL
jgi:TatD DNase family protein